VLCHGFPSPNGRSAPSSPAVARKVFAENLNEEILWSRRDSNPCLPSATRFANGERRLRDVESTPKRPGAVSERGSRLAATAPNPRRCCWSASTRSDLKCVPTVSPAGRHRDRRFGSHESHVCPPRDVYPVNACRGGRLGEESAHRHEPVDHPVSRSRTPF